MDAQVGEVASAYCRTVGGAGACMRSNFIANACAYISTDVIADACLDIIPDGGARISADVIAKQVDFSADAGTESHALFAPT